MIRSTVTFFLFLFGLFFAGLYFAYGSLNPCEALGEEQARRSAAPTAIARLWTKPAPEHMTGLTCSRDLIQSWRERLSD